MFLANNAITDSRTFKADVTICQSVVRNFSVFPQRIAFYKQTDNECACRRLSEKTDVSHLHSLVGGDLNETNVSNETKIRRFADVPKRCVDRKAGY